MIIDQLINGWEFKAVWEIIEFPIDKIFPNKESHHRWLVETYYYPKSKWGRRKKRRKSRMWREGAKESLRKMFPSAVRKERMMLVSSNSPLYRTGNVAYMVRGDTHQLWITMSATNHGGRPEMHGEVRAFVVDLNKEQQTQMTVIQVTEALQGK